MASETDDYEYYAYSSDEDGYALEEDAAAEDVDDMDWNGSADNPNAAPMNFRGKQRSRLVATTVSLYIVSWSG
jgi:hypothetical protein